MNHEQGSDSVQAASPGRLLVTGAHDVRMLDASETSTRGAYMGSTERLPFKVYSVTYDADTELVAVCGAVGMSDDVNLAVFRVVDIPPAGARAGTGAGGTGSAAHVGGVVSSTTTTAAAAAVAAAAAAAGTAAVTTAAAGDAGGTTEGGDAPEPGPEPAVPAAPEPSVMFIPVAEKGVGVMGQYGREMLNCVRFGKSAASRCDGAGFAAARDTTDANDPAARLHNVLLVASQDGHCYVLSIEIKGDAGGGGGDGDGDLSGSDGGQGGRGARRRPRLDAQLIEEARLDFPVAVNAAAASPNGLCAAVAGDADYILVNGGPRGYGASGGGHTEYLAIDGDPETLHYITGEAAGGMYVAWSSNSEYLAATSDSLQAVAVWRITVDKDPAGGGRGLAAGRDVATWRWAIKSGTSAHPARGVPAGPLSLLSARTVPALGQQHRGVGRAWGAGPRLRPAVCAGGDGPQVHAQWRRRYRRY